MRPRARLVALAAACAAAAAAAADPPRTYLRVAQDQEGPTARLVAQLEAAKPDKPDELAYLLDRLLEEGCGPAAAGWLVHETKDESGRERYRGLREHAVVRALAAPAPALAALRGLQERAAERASTTTRGARELLRRWPFSPQGAAAARRLLARAVADADAAGARAAIEALDQLHPGAEPGPGEPAARAMALALGGDPAGALKAAEALKAAGDAAGAGRVAAVAELVRSRQARPRAPDASERLVEQWASAVADGDPPEGEPAPAVALVPTADGPRIVCSNGALLRIWSASGERLARLPHLAAATTRPPDASARFLPRLASWEGTLYAPLALERWLAPGRTAPGSAEAAFAGRFYSLLAVDPREGRVAWWDGDAGPRGPTGGGPAGGVEGGAPPGLSGTTPGVASALRRSHVVACAADGARVYVAAVIKGAEPELALFAWTREAGRDQALVLTPAWPAPVSLFSVERAGQMSADDEAVVPEVAAALALDGAGRVVLTTDAGIVAAVDAASGDVLWLHRPVRAGGGGMRGRNRGFQERGPGTVPPGPARFIAGPRGPCAVAVAGNEVVAIDLARGDLAWASPCSSEARLLVAAGHVVIYSAAPMAGSNQPVPALVIEGRTGKLRAQAPVFAGGPPCGEGLALGTTLLIPTRDPRGAGWLTIRRLDLEPDTGALRIAPPLAPLANLRGEAQLAATPDGLVVATARRVACFAWKRPE